MAKLFFIHSTFITTIFYFVPHFFPFFAPGKWQPALLAQLARQIRFFSHAHGVAPANGDSAVKVNRVAIIQCGGRRLPSIESASIADAQLGMRYAFELLFACRLAGRPATTQG